MFSSQQQWKDTDSTSQRKDLLFFFLRHKEIDPRACLASYLEGLLPFLNFGNSPLQAVKNGGGKSITTVVQKTFPKKWWMVVNLSHSCRNTNRNSPALVGQTQECEPKRKWLRLVWASGCELTGHLLPHWIIKKLILNSEIWNEKPFNVLQFIVSAVFWVFCFFVKSWWEYVEIYKLTFRLYISLKVFKGSHRRIEWFICPTAEISTTSNGETPPPSGLLQIKQHI